MSALRASVRRQFGQRACAFFAALAAIALCGSQSAFAGLIFTQLQFDGFVRSGNGSGPVAGVEQHFTSVDFPPPTSNISLPATNPPLAPPLDPSNNLRMQFDFAANAPLNGDTFPRGTIWITSPTTGQVFANDLDDTLATPVEFDTYVYLQELAADQQLIFEGIRVESGNFPFPPAADTFISNNAGSAADPIHVHLKLTQDQVSFGLLKVHFYYDTAVRTIPEPATATMLLCAMAGAVSMRRRSR